ncbi:MAG TPA: glycosyltransferase family 2 protein [Solirubrobacterales bacterium]|nr:glycosyltransferase family 2 protein [Solirubrobacterales bacterium]
MELTVAGERVELQAASSAEEPRGGQLKALLRDELAGLEAERRNEIVAELASSPLLEEHGSLELSGSLYEIREVLRERLPACAVDARQPVGLAVEQILAVDERCFWVSGWMHDEDGEGEVTFISPEGARVPLGDRAFRFERPDVVQFYAGLHGNRTKNHGFTAFLELPAPTLLSSGWIAELQTSQGVAVEIACPDPVLDPQAVRAKILGELGSRGPVGGALASDHGRYALTRLQERILAESEIDSIDAYGEAPAAPTVSIVVPLYKRLDFLEHQLLHFSTDPDFGEAELIYVLDSVDQKEELKEKARELFALYRLPFKVVNLTSGAGFAGANRHGIEVAEGEQLLLLNSDVIPDRPGWITAMRRFYESREDIGALGAKLLYEDDSLQHAGLYFHRAPGSELWENAHCFKGLHRDFPAATVARAVPAVTAACMLVDRERYEEAGGLPIHYVQGDYEDSELCLRLVEAGYENWYLPAVELYHLEGQSYVAETRRVPSEYNMWLHSEIWGDRIEELMADFTPFDGSAGA